MNDGLDEEENDNKTFGDNLDDQGGTSNDENSGGGEDSLNGDEQQGEQGDSLVDKAQDVKGKIDDAKKAGEMAKKGADAAKTAQTASTAGGAAAGGAAGGASAVLGVLWPVLIAIIIIIVVIGFVMFIVLMPGMVMGKIKEFAESFWGWFMDLSYGKENNIREEEIAEVANYLENMGYDLKGYGFVSGNVDEAGLEEAINTSIKNNQDYIKEREEQLNGGKDLNGNDLTDDARVEIQKDIDKAKEDLAKKEEEKKKKVTGENNEYFIDQRQGILRYNDDKSVKAVKSIYIEKYLTSNFYMYLIKNINVSIVAKWNNMSTMDKVLGVAGTAVSFVVGAAAAVGVGLLAGFLGLITFGIGTIIVLAVAAAAAGVAMAFVSPISMLEETVFGGNPEYGTGLISIYKDTGTIGERAGYPGHNWLTKEKEVEVMADMEKKELTIVAKGMNGRGLKYNVEGWTGRYGMPLEFLLSLHIATMTPDLPLAMSTYFQTDVEILLHQVDGTVTSGYLPSSSSTGEETSNYGSVNILELAEICEILDVKYDRISKMHDNKWLIDFMGDDINKIDNENLYKIFEKGLKHSEACTCGKDVPGAKGAIPAVSDTGEKSCVCSGCTKNPCEGSNLSDDVNKCDGTDCGNVPCSVCTDVEERPDKIVCKECRMHIVEIMQALDVLSGDGKEDKFKGYIPYINQVTDHWFRDLYFTSLADGFKNEINGFIVTDKEYEMKTEERWSLFQVYINQEDYNSLWNKSTDEEREIIEKTYKPTDDEDLEWQYVLIYSPSKGTDVYTDEDGKEYKKGDDFLPTSERAKEIGTSEYAKEKGIPVTKVVVTDEVENNVEGKNYWSAYGELEEGQTDYGQWEQYEIEDDDASELTKLKDTSAGDSLYFKLQIDKGEMKQVEDGIRGQTNPHIKKMFLEDEYFKFDGSVDKADQIILLKDLPINGKAYNEIEYPKTTGNKTKEERAEGKKEGEVEAEKTMRVQLNTERQAKIAEIKEKQFIFTREGEQIKEVAEYSEGDTIAENQFVVKGSELIAKISLSKDSLTAFSILENIHTLDAELVYKDFKELIVELDYFDKEDLAKARQDVMEWVLPEIGSAGWPVRRFDKLEGEFGTLIHSKEAYNIKRQKLIEEISENMIEDDTLEPIVPEEGEENQTANLDAVSSVQIASLGALPEFDVNLKADVKNLMGSATDKDPSQVSIDEFLTAAKEVHANMEKEAGLGFEYCQGPTNLICDPSPHVHAFGHGRYGTVQASMEANRKADCSSYVSWVVQKVGLLKEGVALGSSGFKSTFPDYYIEIDQAGELQPGDILIFDGHVQINGEIDDSTGACIQYNAGSANAIQTLPAAYIPGKNNPVIGVVRFPFSGSVSTKPFEGYEPGQLVTSPVSGELLECGTTIRKNVETGEEEEVGYVMIKVLPRADAIKFLPGSNDDERLKNSIEGRRRDVDPSEDKSIQERLDKIYGNGDGKVDNDPALKELGYYTFFSSEYSNFGANIEGYIVYMDGFDSIIEYQEIDTGEDAPKYKGGLPKIDGNNIKITLDNISVNRPESETETEIVMEDITDEDGNLLNTYKKEKVPTLLDARKQIVLDMEEESKLLASPVLIKTMEVKGSPKEKVYIKEGTVLGITRDFTAYKDEDGAIINYKEEEVVIGADEEDPEMEQKVLGEVGNYIRVVMRDEVNDAIIENIEDYFELDQAKSADGDWVLFYWLPFESGALYAEAGGPVNTGSCAPWKFEVGVGMIQWTSICSYTSPEIENLEQQLEGSADKDALIKQIQDLRRNGHDHKDDMNNVKRLLQDMINAEPSYGGVLGNYLTMSIPEIWDNRDKLEEDLMGLAPSTMPNGSPERDRMIEIQFEIAKKDYYEPLISDFLWLKSRPMAVQGAVLHLRVWGASTSDLSESMNDEAIMDWVRDKIANTGTSMGAASGDTTSGRAWNEPEVGKNILKGVLSEDDIENFVKNFSSSIIEEFKAKGVDWK